MQIREYIDNVCNQIRYKPIRNEIAEELTNHLEECKENYIQDGMKETEAELNAVKQMGDAEKVGKQLNKIHRPKLDVKLLLIIGIVLFFSILVALTRANSLNCDIIELNGMSNYETEQTQMSKYFIGLLLGVGSSILIYFFDYRKLNKISNYLYIGATLSLFVLSSVTLALPLYVLSFIGFLQETDGESKQIKGIKINLKLLKLLILSILSLVFFTVIPSLATGLILAITYLIISIVKLVMSNNKKGLAILLCLVVSISLLGVIGICTNEHIITRLKSSYYPESDPLGYGYIGVNQQKIIDSAKTFGTAHNTSDAIKIFDEGTNYAVISILAHYGWIVSGIMLLAIVLLNVKLIINAVKIKDTYGKLIIIGIASLFILQTVFNILMNFNLGAKADFNIPLISYGNINLVINMMTLALVLSIYRRKDIIINNEYKVSLNS